MTKLRVLCPQTYDGMDMTVTPCDRCGVGWNQKEKRCNVYIGTEKFPSVANPPTCSLEASCQHNIQAPNNLCDVRRAGLVCESALIHAGVENALNHPLSFHAYMMGEE